MKIKNYLQIQSFYNILEVLLTHQNIVQFKILLGLTQINYLVALEVQ